MRSNMRKVTYRVDDFGYGKEYGTMLGFWKERDCWGKRELRPVFDRDASIYLFDDEVIADEAI